MQNIGKGYFYDRTEKQVYFGTINMYSTEEIAQIIRNYLYDVIKYMFNEIPNNKRIILPSKFPDKINKLFSTNDIKYYFSGAYIVFESKDPELKNEIIETFMAMFESRFPITHLKIGFPSTASSTESYLLTNNSCKFFELLPFPEYIIWAYDNPDKLMLKTNEKTLYEWRKTLIKQIQKINIIKINQDIISFSFDIDSNLLDNIL